MPMTMDKAMREELKSKLAKLPKTGSLDKSEMDNFIKYVEKNLESSNKYARFIEFINDRVRASTITDLKAALIDVLCDPHIFDDMESDTAVRGIVESVKQDVFPNSPAPATAELNTTQAALKSSLSNAPALAKACDQIQSSQPKADAVKPAAPAILSDKKKDNTDFSAAAYMLAAAIYANCEDPESYYVY